MYRQIIATALFVAAASAQATSVATLTARTSVNNLYYFGGFATSSDEGEVGDPGYGVTVTDFAPHTLSIVGSDYADLAYLYWTGFLAETWDQAQTYSFAQSAGDVAVTIDGHATISQTSIICSEITGCGPATELHQSTNTLALEFSVDGSTSYTLTGATSGNQWIDLLQWNEPASRWLPVVYGALDTQNVSFDLSGTLDAGLYMLRNNPYMFSGGGPTDVVNTWQAQLTLLDTVAAVPELATWQLALTGIALLAWLGRRRGASDRSRESRL